MERFVVVENVGKTYGAERGAPVAALHGVGFTLEKGTFTALVGPSGCGKSTLLHLLGALDAPDAGRLVVDGKDLSLLSETERDAYRLSTAGTVFQFFNLLPTMSAGENVMLPALLAGASPRDAEERAARLLETVGVAAKRDSFPYEMSGGERQRVAIARALVNRPALLLCDEPTGSLDSKAGHAVLRLLASLVDSFDVTIVMATHSPDAASAATGRLSLLDGRIVE
ncbi:MAG TPA: ABC transporter ATP-binding protein [Thermoanaerobaculia bacterium]|nr:ABC transporter ATP-binding protein [Thermoanaerobaculia bacterium]